MKPKYSKRTVDEAVQLLDVYASQAGWGTGMWWLLSDVASLTGADLGAARLAHAARDAIALPDCQHSALEAAQRLREGWRP
jgi:hypothetical protein